MTNDLFGITASGWIDTSATLWWISDKSQHDSRRRKVLAEWKQKLTMAMASFDGKTVKWKI